MEPCWYPNRSKVDVICEQLIFEKSSFFLKEKPIFARFGGSKLGLKIDQKSIQKRGSTWEGILASIFERFWWILGSKLGSKIEQKSIQKGIEKVMKKRTYPRWPKSRSKRPRRPLTLCDAGATPRNILPAVPPGRGLGEGKHKQPICNRSSNTPRARGPANFFHAFLVLISPSRNDL